MAYAVLILIALATRAIGDFRPSQYAVAEAVIFGWLWLRQKSWFESPPVVSRALIWVSAAAVVGIYLHADILAKYAILFATILLIRRGADDNRRDTANWVLLSLALYSIVWTVLFYWPVTYNIVRKFSFWYSDIFSALAPPQMLLGPTASGWGIIVAGLVFLIALHLRSPRASWANTLIGVLLVLAGQWAFWALAYPLTFKVAPHIAVTKAAFIHLSVFYLIWVLIAVRVMAWIHSPQGFVASTRKPISRSVWGLLGAVALLAILFAGPFTTYGGEHKRVLMINGDKLDSMTPNFTRFGDRSGGMFGMLPKFCRGLGYDVQIANVTPEIFDSIDVIIFANLLDSLPRWQRDSVLSFVQQGGGILGLADHTGHTAIRGPTNDLLEPMGLSLNFDTAVPLRRSWVGQMRYHPHRMSQSATIHANLEIWLGASVEPAVGAMPVVVGTHAYSDPGEILNKDRSYLGNLEYDPGEPLGDIVVVAASNYGKGRAALFGDTSPYQNGALVNSHRLATRTLDWLAGGGPAFWDFLRTWGLPIILVLGMILVLTLLASRTIGLGFLIVLPLMSISLWNLYPAGEPDGWIDDEMRLAYIDASHGQVYDLMGWEKYSIGGLEFNLMRNGFAPQVRQHWKTDWLEKAALVLITRPTQAVDRSEIDDLAEYVEAGGWVVVTAGYEEQEHVRELLEEFDLSIANVPLGRAEGLGVGEKPIFARAYQVSSSNPEAEVLCESSRLPIVMALHRGEGGFVLIGDPVFLFNDNLENRDEDYHLENIRYFHALMKATVGTTVSMGRIGK